MAKLEAPCGKMANLEATPPKIITLVNNGGIIFSRKYIITIYINNMWMGISCSWHVQLIFKRSC